MLITDKQELKKDTAEHRVWQGIPGIEVTKGGRIFSAFYSGNTVEGKGNFVALLKSDDGGKTFSNPVTVAFKEEGRCFDEVLWIDPLGRLWMTWSYCSDVEESGVFGAICDDPDAEELRWSDVFFIGKFVMMNKPTVLSDGKWLFPVAVWHSVVKIFGLPPEDYGFPEEEKAAFGGCTEDQGRSCQKLGGAVAPQRNVDEHMILELKDGRLLMLIRTPRGADAAWSDDQGKTWTMPVDSGLGGPCSRLFIRRLKSGRVLLINHYEFTGRNNLTALLSENDGKTWPYKLLLDERKEVSYPDAVETEDGSIYITYDRERGCFKDDLATAMADAREILIAKITEADILAGELVSPGSFLKGIISKLGEYADEAPFTK